MTIVTIEKLPNTLNSCLMKVNSFLLRKPTYNWFNHVSASRLDHSQLTISHTLTVMNYSFNLEFYSWIKIIYL